MKKIDILLEKILTNLEDQVNIATDRLMDASMDCETTEELISSQKIITQRDMGEIERIRINKEIHSFKVLAYQDALNSTRKIIDRYKNEEKEL